jgi:hypothetical protein
MRIPASRSLSLSNAIFSSAGIDSGGSGDGADEDDEFIDDECEICAVRILPVFLDQKERVKTQRRTILNAGKCAQDCADAERRRTAHSASQASTMVPSATSSSTRFRDETTTTSNRDPFPHRVTM